MALMRISGKSLSVSTMADNDSLINKIEGLLRKAERTDNEHERELFMAKADELILKYEIDNVQLFMNEGKREKPILIELLLSNPYRDGKWLLLLSITRSNNCRLIQSRINEKKDGSRYYKIVGYESDIMICKLLFSSLLIQCMMSMARDLHLRKSNESMQGWKKTYYTSFAVTIEIRLMENRKASMASNSEAGKYLPVFVERKDEVDKAVFDLVPGVRPLRSLRVTTSASAMAAGNAAANRANIGNKGIRQQPRLGQ